MTLKPRRIGALAGLLTLAVFAGCAYPVRTVPATHLSSIPGSVLVGDNETLIIVTASGGGTRATALTASVLRALSQARMPGGTMDKSIGVISSVSGGSVAAGYFALAGTDGLKTLETDFVRQDGMAAILSDGLNPLHLARLATPERERIDLLIDYLNKTLFDGKTFADLGHAPDHPFLILNAGDMVEGTPFSFTPYSFDLLCSDLDKFPLATAVAASAAFPIALSPVTLKNYSPCRAQAGWENGMPGWIAEAARTPDLWQINPSRAMRARAARGYALGQKGDPEDPGAPPKNYIHLLDGGITDNLGVTEPMRLLTTQDVSPNLFNRIAQGRIKRVLWIAVNARSFKPSDLDKSDATPGILDMLMGVIGAGIDSKTSSSLHELKTSLVLELHDAGAGLPEPLRSNFAKLDLRVAQVDFDAVSDTRCRRLFHSIATSWALPKHEVDGLYLMGAALLAADPEFQAAMASLNATWQQAQPSVAQACTRIQQPD